VFAFLSKLQCPHARLDVRNPDRIRRVILSLVTICVLCASASAGEQKLVKISNQKKDGRTEFFVENLQDADVTVTLEFELKNLSSTQPLPFSATVAPRTKVSVFTLNQIEPKEESSWSYTYFATWGSMSAAHDESSSYVLPYPSGQSFPVSQGFHGKYSHTGGDCYSIDFKMPEGSPVHAARAGTVVGAKDDSNIGGGNKKYEWDANFILIRHSDGTFGHYVHLQKAGVKVKVGDTVTAGQLIGYSGNTGHSTGPHLHFAVFKAQSGKQRETIPVKFRTTPLMAEVLFEGRAYKAF
jgi:murein DD-endopeptidase MepM/ murein hydrolase activator NlpD